MRPKILMAVLSILFLSNLYGQNQLWDIGTRSSQLYHKVVLSHLSDDTLYVKVYGSSLPISVDSLEYLRREKKSLAAAGILGGMVAGGITGYEIAKNSDPDKPRGGETALGMVLGGVCGFILAEALSSDENIDLRNKNSEEKILILKQLINRK